MIPTITQNHRDIRKTIEDAVGPDFAAAAELFPSRTNSGRQKFGYKRFGTAVEAIRYAIEDVPEAALRGAFMEVDEVRFGYVEIRNLYESAAYRLKVISANLNQK